MVIGSFFSMFSGVILWTVLQRGIGTHGDYACSSLGEGSQGNSSIFVGLHRCEFVDIHSWLSLILLVIIFFHILIHWKWIYLASKNIQSYFSLQRVRKVAEQYIVSGVLLFLFIFEGLCGFVIWLILPRGEFDYYNMLVGTGRTFLGIQRNTWVDLHAWVAVYIICIIVVHVILNWNWITQSSRKIFKRKAAKVK